MDRQTDLMSLVRSLFVIGFNPDINDELSEVFHRKFRIILGCLLSPLLFDVYIEDMVYSV
jgi:hypothetical protein